MPSVAIAEHIKAIDKTRLEQFILTLNGALIDEINEAIEFHMGL
jgi:mRNA-degrading endonuclease toxin of MazEF toxin-antitoxin module